MTKSRFRKCRIAALSLPWKLLIRAIACLHRGEDKACREHVLRQRSNPETAGARLIPAMEAPYSAGKPADGSQTGREAALVSKTSFEFIRASRGTGDSGPRIRGTDRKTTASTFKAVRAAVAGVSAQPAGSASAELKQLIAVRGPR